jgi:hypothetical protein
MKSTQGIPIYLKILKATRRSSMVSTNPKTRRNRSLTTGRHTIGGAPPPEAIPAHTQDDLEEWFPLGITLKVSRQGFDKTLSATSTLQLPNCSK